MIKIRNKIIIFFCIGLLIGIIILVIFLNNDKQVKQDDGIFDIVTTFYPIELIVKNITVGAQNIEIDNITKDVGGCVHEYSLTPEDAKVIEKADVFIINGGDMEYFINNFNLNKINVVDSSKDFQNTEISSHFWMNIDLYIKQVENISNGLIKYNPENKEIYVKNTQEYVLKINKLKEVYSNISSKDINVAIMHDSFYYYKDKFNITASFIAGHEGNSSAAELENFINEIKSSKTRILLVDNETYDENEKLIDTIINDTDVELFILDLIVQNNNDLNNYLDLMEYNYEIIEEMIEYGRKD